MSEGVTILHFTSLHIALLYPCVNLYICYIMNIGMNVIAGGVIIGVALLHLAPDADENLSEEYGYPVTFVLMG